MKLTPLLILLCFGTAATGQHRVDVSTNNDIVAPGRFVQDAQGIRLMANTTYYRAVEGSPFFSDGWMKGAAALTPQREYQNLYLKLDLLSGKLHFRDLGGEEMICTTPIYSVSLQDSITGQHYDFVHSSYLVAAAPLKLHAWLQMLADGKAQLFVHHKKTMSETRPYGSATLEQRVTTFDIFYLVVNGQMERVKKPRDIVSALSDKKTELEAWMGDNPAEKDATYLSKMVSYYNSLFK